MKTKLLFAVALFISFLGFTQNNGWYVYDKALEITSITPDDTNANELHLGTSLGYIKYNTMTNQVTDFLNLTSQNPAIAKVKDIAVNPTNNTIAFTMPGAIVIYDGTTVTKYTYQNSSLTLGSTASTFTFLQVEYGVNGELYIFKEDVSGYQIFNNGVFETEVVTTFRPQDIIENQAGTKVFFAGWNDGLWELEKATNTFTNYTTSNSSLIFNALNTLYLDNTDVLFIGGNRGFNTLTPAGVWSTYQQLIPPFNVIFYPVGSIHKNSNGDVLVDTSVNNAGQGITVVDLATNTWTNYGTDNINCLNESFINAVAYGNNDNIYVSNKFPAANTDALDLFLFDPVANTCTVQNINYLNAMVTSTFNVADFNIRKKLSGTYDIGFTKFNDLYQFNIDPTTFAGGFPNVTTITPSAGKPVFSLISDNEFFIVENNTGWVFIDDANNASEFNHNLPNYLAIVTQKAAAFNSDNGIINLVHKGFDAAFNYRVYKTQCNTATTTCSVPEEIFTNNRDFTQNILFGADQDPTTGQVSVVAVKTGSAAAGSATKSFGGNFYRTNVSWDGYTNGIHINGWDEIHDVVPLRDPTHSIKDQFSVFIPNSTTISIRTEHPITGNPVITNLSSPHSSHFIDWTSIDLIFPGTDVNPIVEIMASLEAEPGRIDGSTQLFIDESYVNLGGVPNMVFTQISGATIDNDLPNDLFITKVIMKQYSLTEAFLMLLTNYGILIKTAIDITNLLLSTDDVSLKEANLLLYPNPANEIVSFSNNSIKTITVYDINGRKVLSTTNRNSFSVKTLAHGIYIVKGKNDNNVVVTKKLVVE